MCLELQVNLRTIASYVPMHQLKKEWKRKGPVFERLEGRYKQCTSYDIKITVGDTKAKLGKEIWTGISVSTCRLQDGSDDNGTRVINGAVLQRMVIGGTLFPYRNIYNGTWLGPDDRTVNRIDHVMIDQLRHSNLLDVRIHRGANADLHHHLGVARLRCRTAQRNILKITKAPFKYNKERLGVNEVKQEYAIKLVNHIQEADGKNNLNWSVLKTLL